ncbi:group II intron reverse transcriptase/maturase [Candidatus Methanoperedens nitratireducens]|uniref:RNA-directed DNA polymerase n=1 Tax=Candidatus Methanoperedens nitratireducens TaxID=1392998 RepID=A0A284VP98_9EURY|nr:group II intron reverse transcriptase/maturase [Candidatus Methanoperedens nitroreducens]SNQ61007.1 RNA-directed DNA polymerase [Candidatus Methanoperedens nitroreducens]
MNARNSITSKDEKLANRQLKDQWNNINWKKVEKLVNRLQVRITKAVKEDKWYLVKRLQYLLTHSYYAKLLATRNPTQNKGKRTAGIDGETWSSPEAKMKAALSLTDKKYVAKPLKRVYIEKHGSNKKRPLGIPTMHDRAMQSLYALTLEPIAEATGDRTSFGFRKFRSTHDAYQQIFVCMCRENSPKWILEGDIKGCFDNISHQWLINNIPMDESVLKQFLKAGYIFDRHLFPTEAGTPQGGIISPILANMTLDGIEKLLADRYHKGKNGRTNKNHAAKYKVNFIRYADDFIITARTEEIAKEVKELIKGFLKDRGLELSDEKTLITHIDNGFDFLGWNFRKYNGTLLVKPCKKSIDKVTEKISNTIDKGKTWKQEKLIDALNPIITGWSNYHQSAVSSETFHKLDSRIWNMLWHWAKRRHPDKSKQWIISKYWHSSRKRNWVFSMGNRRLNLLSDTKIIRHINLKLDMNPYLDKDYFVLRKIKLGTKKLTSTANNLWDKVNKIWLPETETMKK